MRVDNIKLQAVGKNSGHRLIVAYLLYQIVRIAA